MTSKIGTKIKQLREEKNISLEELSSSSTIHAPQLEMIESGELTPSMGTMIKITRAMGIRLGTILDGSEGSEPVLHHAKEQKPAVSTANNKEEAREHLNYFTLAGEKSDRHMEPFFINACYCAPGEGKSSHHEGEEFLYVIEGDVVLRYGNQTYNLSTGDSIYYDSIVPHCLSTDKEGETAKVLAVTYTPF